MASCSPLKSSGARVSPTVGRQGMPPGARTDGGRERIVQMGLDGAAVMAVQIGPAPLPGIGQGETT